jgi:hypothetical protein
VKEENRFQEMYAMAIPLSSKGGVLKDFIGRGQEKPVSRIDVRFGREDPSQFHLERWI